MTTYTEQNAAAQLAVYRATIEARLAQFPFSLLIVPSGRRG